jgi:hypothetical protein
MHRTDQADASDTAAFAHQIGPDRRVHPSTLYPISLLNMRFQQSCQQMILVLGGHSAPADAEP